MRTTAYLSIKPTSKTRWSDKKKAYVALPAVAGVTQSPPKSLPRGHLLIKVNIDLPDDVFDGFIPEVTLPLAPSSLVGPSESIVASADDATDWVGI